MLSYKQNLLPREKGGGECLLFGGWGRAEARRVRLVGDMSEMVTAGSGEMLVEGVGRSEFLPGGGCRTLGGRLGTSPLQRQDDGKM